MSQICGKVSAIRGGGPKALRVQTKRTKNSNVKQVVLLLYDQSNAAIRPQENDYATSRKRPCDRKETMMRPDTSSYESSIPHRWHRCNGWIVGVFVTCAVLFKQNFYKICDCLYVNPISISTNRSTRFVYFVIKKLDIYVSSPFNIL